MLISFAAASAKHGIECDQIVVSIGQDINPLIQNLKDFTVIEDQSESIPLGTASKDKRILAWGAAASTLIGLSPKEKEFYTAKLSAYTSTLPRECHSNGHVYVSTWAIKKMAAQLRKEKLFPENKNMPSKFDLPDINQATRCELKQLMMSSCMTMAESEAELIVEKIIQERSTKSNGIKDAKQLATLLPGNKFSFFVGAAFPFGEIKRRTKARVKKRAVLELPFKNVNTSLL